MMAWRFIHVRLMTTRAQRITLSAQIHRVRVVAIYTLNAGGTHPTLLERTVNKHFFFDLPGWRVKRGSEQFGLKVIEKRLAKINTIAQRGTQRVTRVALLHRLL